MNTASKQYFEQVAENWDALRAGFFTEEVRLAAIRKAYLRPEYAVVDMGAGTGFLSAALAPLVRRVYAVDSSPEMLAMAKKNLAQFENVEFHQADGLAIPLPDESVDVVFANMYLHHCPDPLAAISEMVRILVPGGRLVITDLEVHNLAWLKTDMSDEWLGFERPQVRAWFEQAGLVNVLIDYSGENCRAKPPSGKAGEANISIFVAAGTRHVAMQSLVQQAYSAAAQGGCGCGSAQSENTPDEMEQQSCCCQAVETPGQDVRFNTDYSLEERQAVPADAEEISLGCGNPIALANLRPGEMVVDIGSGGGMDSFLAAQRVGPGGRVIGVDMTPAMLERARRSAEKNGFSNVEFRQGEAQALPVEDGSVDVVLSNCVINLCEDKGKVFKEAYRVLKPGGRLEVSDVVTSGALPLELRLSASEWAGCVSGALPEQEYLDLATQAGFTDLHTRRSTSAGRIADVDVYSIILSARK